MDEKEKKKWLTLYPIYFAKELSIPKGRRASLEDCIENINSHKIAFNLKSLGIPCIVQNICKHPRDFFQSGRIKFRLVDDSDKFINPEIYNKKLLYKAMGKNWEKALEEYNRVVAEQNEAAEKKREEMKKQAEEQGLIEKKEEEKPDKKKKKKGKK